jgi:hypothetical protein
MFTKSKPMAVQVMRVQPPVLRSAGDGGTAYPICPLSASAGDRLDAPPPQTAASHTFAQTFGLDFRAASLTVLIDLMLVGGDVFSLGLLIPLGVVVAAVHSFIVYKIQTHWYGDDHDSALIKAMIVGLLTAIPVPLAPFIAVPSGIVGIVKAVRRK